MKMHRQTVAPIPSANCMRPIEDEKSTYAWSPSVFNTIWATHSNTSDAEDKANDRPRILVVLGLQIIVTRPARTAVPQMNGLT